MIKVAINGYGRIGRVAHRVILEKYSDQIEVVAINGGSSTDLTGWGFLLKYDTAYGSLKGHTVISEQGIGDSPNNQVGWLVVDEKRIPFFSQKDPSLLPWKDLGVDVVIECTGHFTTAEKIKAHLDAGAKKAILSAPAKDSSIKTYVLGVNASDQDKTFSGETDGIEDSVVSNASCTTNCIAPVAQIMSENFGIEKATMTTIHSYTSDQELQDGGHSDYRRGRAAAHNIVPTTTGATIAAAETVPELKDLFAGLSIRVPIIVGSLSDFTFVLKKDTTKGEVNTVISKAADLPRYKHILEVTTDPIVSSDIIGNSYSSIVDLSLTQVIGGNLVKVIAWYDNEWGYANRLVEEAILVGQ